MMVIADLRELVYSMKDFFLVLIGGICSVIGGCIAIWYQAKKARQIRMEEVRGEQGVEACKKALSLTDSIQRRWILCEVEAVLKVLDDNGEWFSMNQILLPHTFVENWRSIDSELSRLKSREKGLEPIDVGPKRNEAVAEIETAEKFIQKLADEAEKALRKELKLPEVKIKKWKKTNET